MLKSKLALLKLGAAVFYFHSKTPWSSFAGRRSDGSLIDTEHGYTAL